MTKAKMSHPPPSASSSEKEDGGQKVGPSGPSLGIGLAPDIWRAGACLQGFTVVSLSTCAWARPFTLLWSEGA